ncbi:MAG: helix-turn-helix domain-containing protein [Gammaproteobacteria bacterium]|nr:helix-turn-helix domain-containing protein [Gammaproteobacteria bacterium]
MNIRPIRTKKDYARALARVAALMDARAGTPEGDELDVLATLVEAYEDRHLPMAAVGALDAILFRMEQQGLTRKDLEPYLGSRHRVSEILSGRRQLSLAMIRRLHAGLKIPLENLIHG